MRRRTVPGLMLVAQLCTAGYLATEEVQSSAHFRTAFEELRTLTALGLLTKATSQTEQAAGALNPASEANWLPIP